MLLRWRRLRVSGPGQGARPGPGNRRGRRRPRRSTRKAGIDALRVQRRCAHGRCRGSRARESPGTPPRRVPAHRWPAAGVRPGCQLHRSGRGQILVVDPGVAQVAAGYGGRSSLPSSSRSVLCRCTGGAPAGVDRRLRQAAACAGKEGRQVDAGAVRAGRACCRPTRRSSQSRMPAGEELELGCLHHGCWRQSHFNRRGVLSVAVISDGSMGKSAMRRQEPARRVEGYLLDDPTLLHESRSFVGNPGR